MAKVCELLGSLSEMEETAARIYSKAALAVKDDTGLRELLEGLALEELEHKSLLSDFGVFISSSGVECVLSLDEDAVNRTRDYLSVAEKRIDAGRLTNGNLIDCIATTESSEWNREFLKVVDWFKLSSRSFIPGIARVQQHKRSVERFLVSRPGFERFLVGMKSLSAAWVEKLLVVDDDESVAVSVAALLADEGRVDIASDGEEALEKIGSGYYAAIVSDYSMPLMSGMELLDRAEERFPGISRRFLFFTSDEEMVDVFRDRGVRALHKRASPAELSAEVAAILSRAAPAR
ncbi:MAG: response regulator [Deltaproteobacteria bacterium]|nr:response regulator [Deltaproteobacteria bacterium]